jgi:hypothetical protein
MTSTTTAAILLGLALGTRHALEPDHLAAVSVLNTQGSGARHGLVLGAIWGVGHTVALLGVGVVLALSAAALPSGLTDVFELSVAAMLVVLGFNACVRAARLSSRGPNRHHEHAGHEHVHAGPDAHVHVGRWTFAVRPLLVGMIHGLAGSGALSAWVMTTLHDTSAQLVYIALFGVGSIASMAAISGLAGWPMARLAQKANAARWTHGAAGLFSLIYGLVWGWPPLERFLG